MKRAANLTIFALVLATVVTLAKPVTRNTENSPKAEDDFQLVKVADGVYAATAKSGGLASGNAGFVIGDDGVLVFDTFFTPAAIEELIGEIAAQTRQPIKYAVNSHYHLDHTGGNQVLAARGVFVSHGDFYAATVIDRLDRRPDGLVRAGCACYTTDEEVDRLIDGIRALSSRA